VAVEIKTRDGRTDVCFADGRPDQVRQIGPMKLSGQFAFHSVDDKGLRQATVVGGRVLWEYGDVSRRSYLASVRKSILAMLYGKYVANGTIRLDKTLEELGMDDHRGLLPHEQQATIEHLISARSGIYHPAANPGDNTAELTSSNVRHRSPNMLLVRR